MTGEIKAHWNNQHNWYHS